jgi:hypothetical protein
MANYRHVPVVDEVGAVQWFETLKSRVPLTKEEEEAYSHVIPSHIRGQHLIVIGGRPMVIEDGDWITWKQLVNESKDKDWNVVKADVFASQYVKA